MIDLRLYRIAFLPLAIAIVALLFSLQSRPAPLAPLVPPAGFESANAAQTAQRVVALAPRRTPGSAGDARTASLVERQFRAIKLGQVLEQRFSAEFDGNQVDMRNVMLKLPGNTDRTIVIVAPRDSASGPGAASSAAATGALLELASDLATSRHAHTLLFVSTDGASAGAAGARELAQHYLDASNVDAAVVLDQPGSAQPRQPFLVDSSASDRSGPIQLEETAERSLRDQAGLSPPSEGWFRQLARLAIPSGVGEQAVLIANGVNAIAVSSAGELPLPPSEDQPQDLSRRSLDQFGRTALDLVLSVDSASSPLQRGPDSYIEIGGNLVPGWALATLALAILLPVLVTGVDGLARAGRRGEAGSALRWAGTRALPLLGALAFLYVLALVGVVARPAFPFDPQRIGIGAGEVIVMALLALAAAGIWLRVGGNRPPSEASPEAAATALGLASTLSVLVVWLANPFLALLLAPLAHPWVAPAHSADRRGRALALVVLALALIPFVAALAIVTSTLELGAALPWQALVMVGDGGVPFLIAVGGCFLAGVLAALVVLAVRSRERTPTEGDWTDLRSGSESVESINEAEHRSRPTSGDGDQRTTPGRETRTVEESDRPARVPRGRGRSRRRDPQEAEPDQERSYRPRGERS